MLYDVIWSPEAKKSYVETLQVINKRWSYSELETFENHVREVLEIIKRFPKICEYSEKSDVHQCVLTTQTSLYYRVKDNSKEVELIAFIDNRQDPTDKSF